MAVRKTGQQLTEERARFRLWQPPAVHDVAKQRAAWRMVGDDRQVPCRQEHLQDRGVQVCEQVVLTKAYNGATALPRAGLATSVLVQCGVA